MAGLFPAALACCMILNGCSQNTKIEDAFTADRPGFGIQGQSEDADISWFAKDLCVADEDVQQIEAEASDALAACFLIWIRRRSCMQKIFMPGSILPVQPRS